MSYAARMVGTVEAEQPRRAPRRRVRELGPVPYIGFVGALIVAAITPLWYLSGRAWRLTLPGQPHDGRRPLTAISFVGGVILLGIAWIGLISRAERARLTERERTWAVLLTAALWFVPVMLGPPLLSSDIYSYAAEGAMVTQGLDPTGVSGDGKFNGMYKLQLTEDTTYAHRVDPVWRDDGNPYGPVQMGVAAAAVTATGHDVGLTILALRVLALLAVGVAAWGIHEIARHSGVSPPAALAFAIANPIVVLHVVGGGHNEALLMALLSVGCALALKGRWWLGVLFITLAAGVKLPAAAPLVYFAWVRPPDEARVSERIKEVAKTLAFAIVVLVAACLVVGIGFGWIAAAKNAGTTLGTLAVATQAGFAVSKLLRTLGLAASDDTIVAVLRVVGLGVAGVICLWLLPRARRYGAVRVAGISMLVVILLGPVVWPWYFAPSLALLGATGMGRWRPSLVVLTAFFAGVVFPTGERAHPLLEHSHLVSLLTIVGVGVATLLAPHVAEWWRETRPPTRPLDEAPA
jgi:hypothetical protein